jgi:hypothetical protein
LILERKGKIRFSALFQNSDNSPCHPVSECKPFSVHLPAVESDLRRRSGRRRKTAHLHHRLGKVGGEHAGVAAVLPDQRILRPAVEELLVRVQQAALRHQVRVVGVVEGVRRLVVERREVAVAAALRARLLPRRREGGVDVLVGVDAPAEEEAARAPHGVRAGERRHVARREPLGRERGHEGRGAGARAREVGVGRALARRARVLPAELHVPCGASELHCIALRADQRRFWTLDYYGRVVVVLAATDELTDQVHGVTRRQGDDVGARHGALAGCFDLRLDGVDHLVPADGVGVRSGVLLAGERRSVIQEDGRVTTLRAHMRVSGFAHRTLTSDEWQPRLRGWQYRILKCDRH